MKNKPLSELGQRLENLRLALRLQQKEMALASGLNPGYLSDLINGKKDNPGIETILKIAKPFNVSLNYLLLGEGEMFMPGKAGDLNGNRGRCFTFLLFFQDRDRGQTRHQKGGKRTEVGYGKLAYENYIAV